MLNPGTYLQDRYEILGRIGSGGMSVVYKAKCHTLDRLVAIKVLKEEFASDENFVSKFKMEAQAAARLSHPNIVNVYDVVDEGDLHYIVMELIEGITLKNYIEKKGFLENKEAIGIAIQVAQGIAAAHEQHIIHRDIKPQNMIISKDGTVKVADFGIARAVSSQTMNATAVGSVHYISPEQARGGYCDERSDIYSFGITLYEMVTGRVPFEGDNTVAVALAHLEEAVTPPSRLNPMVSRGLEEIILKCTQKKPDRRYPSIGDVITDLRHVMVDPDYDIYGSGLETDEENDPSITRPISREELAQIQGRRRSRVEEAAVQEVEPEEDETEEPEDFSDEDEYENTISSTGIIIKYKLKSGKIITRQYRRGEVPVSQDENVKDLVANDLTMITKIPVKYLSSCYIQDMQNGGYSSTDKDLNKKLIAALIKDLNNVKKIKKDEYDYSIDINYTDSGENYNYRNGTEISVNIYSEYKNTLKVLNDSGVLAKLEE